MKNERTTRVIGRIAYLGSAEGQVHSVSFALGAGAVAGGRILDSFTLSAVGVCL